MAVHQLRVLPLGEEAGFGDAYILQTLQDFQKTGIIYGAPSSTVSLPGYSQYGPFLYLLLSLPGRLFPGGNPYLAPRAIEVCCFLLCVLVTAAIGGKLIAHRWGWRWCVLLALSFGSMRAWIPQLRGDFPAILFNLTSIWLLLLPRWWAPLAAGLSAGLALQFKVVYVAALAAGMIWLAMQRRWKALATFAGGGLASSLGLLVLILQREPRMLSHLFVLMRQPLYDAQGLFALLEKIAGEPALLLGVAAAPLTLIRFPKRWLLLFLYFFVSFVLAVTTDSQVGGNINYFFESLFAITPFAAFSVLQFGARRYVAAGILMAVLALVHAVPLLAYACVEIWRLPTTAVRNQQLRKLQPVLARRRILSFVPSVTLLTSERIIGEPYLLSYLDRLGKYDLRPLENRIRRQEFEAVITAVTPGEWRGIPHLALPLRPALSDGYEPQCIYGEWLVMRPRSTTKPDVVSELADIGCHSCAAGADCNSW